MMDTQKMIWELIRTASKHKNDKLLTFDTNITAMCTGIIPKLEILLEYEKIGTVEECRAAREKQEPKGPIVGANFFSSYDDDSKPIFVSDYACPECGMGVAGEYICCPYCGQAINFAEREE